MPKQSEAFPQPLGADEPIATLQDAVIDQITFGQQEAIDAVETAGYAAFEGLGRVHQHIADFVAERIRNDLDAHEALLRSRTFDELREAQLRYFTTTWGQYGDEVSRLVRLGAEVAARSLERPRL